MRLVHLVGDPAIFGLQKRSHAYLDILPTPKLYYFWPVLCKFCNHKLDSMKRYLFFCGLLLQGLSGMTRVWATGKGPDGQGLRSQRR